MGRRFPPSELPLYMGWSGPPSNVLPWTHPSPRPKQHLDPFLVFCRAHARNWQTMLPVTTGHIYIRSTVMQPINDELQWEIGTGKAFWSHINFTLVIVRLRIIPATSGSWSCHEHTTDLATGVSRLPVLDCGMTFHPGFGARDSPSILWDDLWKHIFLATEAPGDSLDL